MKFHSQVFGWEYAWQEFAEEHGGSADLDPQAKPSLKAVSVPIGQVATVSFVPGSHANHQTPSDVTVWALVQTSREFRFALRHEHLIDQANKLLGMQDIVIGDKELDQRFVIQSNDKQAITELLSKQELREVLLELPEMQLRTLVSGDKAPNGSPVPPGYQVLYFHQSKPLERFEQLAAVQKIFVSVVEYVTAGEAPVKQRFAPGLLSH